MPVQEQSDAAMIAWRRFLRAHCAISRVLDQELRAQHGLTINDYDVLVQLRDSERQKLRMSDLAESVVLTRSGITRLVDGLVREGLVERVSCCSDARVAYAKITQEGLDRMAAARVTHINGIQRVFSSHFSEEDVVKLGELLGKLPASELGVEGCCAQHES